MSRKKGQSRDLYKFKSQILDRFHPRRNTIFCFIASKSINITNPTNLLHLFMLFCFSLLLSSITGLTRLIQSLDLYGLIQTLDLWAVSMVPIRVCQNGEQNHEDISSPIAQAPYQDEVNALKCGLGYSGNLKPNLIHSSLFKTNCHINTFL